MADSSPLKQRKYTPRWWNSQVVAAEDRHKTFVEKAQESIRVYNTKHKLDTVERHLHVWWYCVNTLLPAYYSSTPKTEVQLRKKLTGDHYQVAANLLQTAVQYELDEGFDFDRVALDAATQFLLTGRAVLWPRYVPAFEKRIKEVALRLSEDGSYIGPDDKPYDAKGGAVVTMPDGSYAGMSEYEAKAKENAILETVQYCDYLESDARNESEIEWRARCAHLSEDGAIALFGKDTADKLSYDAYPGSMKYKDDKERSIYQGKARVWEIWDLNTEKVYYLQAKGDKSFLESGNATTEFEGFFPCEVINASLDPDSTIPTSDYAHARDQIIEVERLTTRIHAVTQAVRTNFAYDATMEQLGELLTGDLKGVPVKSWPSYKGRGGLAAAIDMLPIDPYVQALGVLQEARQSALNQLYETLKISELLRGVSDPRKTATANRLENQWSSLGLIVRQNEFAKFIGKSLGKLADVMCQHFSEERLLEAGDADTIVASMTQDPMQAAQLKLATLEILRNKSERCYRINVTSDSMQALDQRQERQDGADLMSSAGSFLQQMQAMVEQYPPMAMLAGEMLRYTMGLYRGGKEIQPIFTQVLQQTAQLAEQKMAQGNQQPQDHSVQVAMIKAQSEQQKMQQDAQMEQLRLQQDAQLKQMEMQLELKRLDIELIKIQSQATAEATNQAITMELKRIEALAKEQELQVKAMQVQIQGWESIQEERRLAKEANMEEPRA